MQTIDRNKIAKELEAFCDQFATYSAAAKKLGITLAQLSTARNNENTVIPAKALDKLGYGHTLVYVRKADMPAKTKKPGGTKKPAAKKAKAKPAAKRAPAKAKAKKPAKKKAVDKPAPAPVSTPRPKTERRPARPKVDVAVQAPPAQRDVPSTTPPVKVVNVTGNGASFD